MSSSGLDGKNNFFKVLLKIGYNTYKTRHFAMKSIFKDA